MDIIPVKTPSSVKLLFPKYTWDFYSKNERKIFLSFDDGPIPELTEFVVDQLKNYHAKATFFCIGDNIKKHPEVFKKVIAAGHSIGNHTMHHLKARKSELSDYIANVQECEKEIEKHTLTKNKLFRPPYGQLSKSKLTALQKQGYKIILWDILSKDWDHNTSQEQCTTNVIKNAKNGSIIVFHDSIKASKNLKTTLPKVLRYFTEKGYTFESI